MTTGAQGFCGKCGAVRVAAADAFCRSCGAPYATKAPPAPVEPTPVEPTVAAPEEPLTPPNKPAAAQSGNEEPCFGRKPLHFESTGETLKRAVQDYGEAIRLEPQFGLAYLNRGIAYAKLGEHQRAVQDYDENIRLNRQNARAYYSRANGPRRRHDARDGPILAARGEHHGKRAYRPSRRSAPDRPR
jgi:hypothetical protein